MQHSERAVAADHVTDFLRRHEERASQPAEERERLEDLMQRARALASQRAAARKWNEFDSWFAEHEEEREEALPDKCAKRLEGLNVEEEQRVEVLSQLISKAKLDFNVRTHERRASDEEVFLVEKSAEELPGAIATVLAHDHEERLLRLEAELAALKAKK